MFVELLTGEDYAVEIAPDGQRGLHFGLSRQLDLMIVDRALPAIEGLDAGAEDNLSKPFDIDELLARLRALRRRPARRR